MDYLEHQNDLRARRVQWEAEKKAEAEEEARREARGRMQAFLAAKRQSWVDHTGSLPPEDVMTTFQLEYLAERAADEEAERALRLSQAEDIAAG